MVTRNSRRLLCYAENKTPKEAPICIVRATGQYSKILLLTTSTVALPMTIGQLALPKRGSLPFTGLECVPEGEIIWLGNVFNALTVKLF